MTLGGCCCQIWRARRVKSDFHGGHEFRLTPRNIFDDVDELKFVDSKKYCLLITELTKKYKGSLMKMYIFHDDQSLRKVWANTTDILKCDLEYTLT